MAQLFKNNIFGVLQSGIGNSATSMMLTDASSFPAPTGGDHYLVTLVGFGSNGSENAWEIVKVTAKASNTLTVVRAQEGTTAVSWPGATQVQMRLTAGSLDTKVDKIVGKGLSTEDYSTAEKSKLAAVAAGATANATNAELRDRATHTGEQAISTVTGLQSALNGKEAAGVAASAVSAHTAAGDPHPQYTTAAEAASAAPVQSVAGRTGAVTLAKADVGLGNVDNTSDASKPISTATQTALDARILTSARGAANGVASLDSGGKVPESQLPAVVVSDVFSVASEAAMLALTAERGDIAVRSDLNKTFALSTSPASTLGNWVELRTPTDAVLSVAGKTGAVTLAKADVGLGSVDNTADSVKPVSTATQVALDAKQATLVSGTNIKTVNSTSLLGAGDVSVEPTITKAAGYAKWTGAAWSFVNETYSLSTHNHSGTYQTAQSVTGLVKSSGITRSAAVAGTDYVTPTGVEVLTNKTLQAGVFTDGYTEETAVANTTTAYTVNLANGSVQFLTLTGNCTYTFPTPAAGKSFTLVQKQDATGSRTVTWPASVKWPGGTAPTITSTASKVDKFVFTAIDGSSWLGSVAGLNYTA